MAQDQGKRDGVSRDAAPFPTDTLIAPDAAGRNPADIAIPTQGSEARSDGSVDSGSGGGGGHGDVVGANGSGSVGASGTGGLGGPGRAAPPRGLAHREPRRRNQQPDRRQRLRRRSGRRHAWLNVDFDIGRFDIGCDIRCLDGEERKDSAAWS
jgi:hypothetical protein